MNEISLERRQNNMNQTVKQKKIAPKQTKINVYVNSIAKRTEKNKSYNIRVQRDK